MEYGIPLNINLCFGRPQGLWIVLHQELPPHKQEVCLEICGVTHIANFGTELPDDKIVFLDQERLIGESKLRLPFEAKYVNVILPQEV